jgi:hypothetical protein
MEIEKKSEKFSFGFGTEKVAGSGSLDRAQDAPDNVRTKYDKTQIAKNVGKAALLSAAVIFKHKFTSKRRSK